MGIAISNHEDNEKELGKLMSKVVNKGTKLPCKKKRLFQPSHDYQKKVLIQVFEGENKYIKDNYLLGKFELLNLPQKKKMKSKLK